MLRFLIILYLDLYFVSEVQWSSGACTGGSENPSVPPSLPRADSQPSVPLTLQPWSQTQGHLRLGVHGLHAKSWD